MSLTNIVSDVRSGKTLWATILALTEKSYANARGFEPRPVLANYKIEIPNWRSLRPQMLHNIDYSCLVILDEAWAWLEARRSGTPIHIFMSSILFQSGKTGIDIVLTDQIEGTIDKRYRLLMNYRVECENLGEGVGFIYYFQKRIKGGFTEPTVKFLPYSEAEKVFPFYNTYELINPMDDSLLFKVSDDKEETMEIVSEIVDKMLKIFPAGVWKLPMIENYCLKRKHPKYLVKLIHGELRTKIAEQIYNKAYRKSLKSVDDDD
jgi:hypothetical protein